ncbi:MAG TPA: alpha/beta hydrolase [Pseudonocardiaceae bacterium]
MASGRLIGIIGGVVGVATAGLTIAGIIQNRRKLAIEGGDPFADEPFGKLPADRTRTVAADDGVPLSVEQINPATGGKPDLTVVLVHGFALSRLSWHFQRRDLAKLTDPKVSLVLYDQRGHGRSGEPSEESCTIDQLGRDLDVILRSVVPDGPLVLVGHSMGGMTIMALAEQQPELFADRVRGVALIGTSAGEVGRRGLPRPLLSKYNPLTRTVGDIASSLPGLVDWVRSAGGGVTRQAVRWLAFGDRSVPSSLVDFMVQMLAVTPVPVLTHFVPTLGTHNRFAALAGLRHTQVLVLSGDHDQLTPFSHAERIAAELPDAKLVRAFGAGHMVMLEQSDLVTNELIDLLRSCAISRLRQLRLRRNK